ncbi:metal-dependent hydrolase [Variovorax sp. PCZ-1]|uniref:metal-dependent hydrolase n=1 Tax=Variovorax sp. PCZ-1 TaxID=2835533 RepID=UPI001BCAD680|nr:metal-dependent hydrolase [Variovorax sp. PCZ-1]MBS7807729.1 metal-dependent hydrolase [Variovorax sp. PCZ-1]
METINYSIHASQPSSASMTIRALQIDFSQGFDRRWFGGDAFRSAYFNAMSMTFPLGEQSFIDSVKGVDRFIDERIESEAERAQLRAQLTDFSAQEATHRHIHAQYNAVLAKQGFENAVEKRIEKRLERYKTEHPMNLLAATCAYEHYTAILSDVMLKNPAASESMTPMMRRLWLWHALEETEHKAVAFDLYKRLGGHERGRIVAYLLAMVFMQIDAFLQTTNNLRRDGALWKPSTLWGALTFYFGRPSKGNGWIWMTTRPLLAYFKRDFHPHQLGETEPPRAYASEHAQDWRVVRQGSVSAH